MADGVLNEVQYLPLCVGLTALGLVATVLVWRRRGVRAGLRMLAWSLLPAGLALVGAARVVWDLLSSLARFAVHLTFSPVSWIGLGLLGVSLVLFVVTGALASRRLAGLRRGSGRGPGTEVDRAGDRPAVRGGSARPAADPEMAEIERILRDRGIG